MLEEKTCASKQNLRLYPDLYYNNDDELGEDHQI